MCSQQLQESVSQNKNGTVLTIVDKKSQISRSKITELVSPVVSATHAKLFITYPLHFQIT